MPWAYRTNKLTNRICDMYWRVATKASGICWSYSSPLMTYFILCSIESLTMNVYTKYLEFQCRNCSLFSILGENLEAVPISGILTDNVNLNAWQYVWRIMQCSSDDNSRTISRAGATGLVGQMFTSPFFCLNYFSYIQIPKIIFVCCQDEHSKCLFRSTHIQITYGSSPRMP